VGSTIYSGVLGARIAAAGSTQAEGGTIPNDETPDDVVRTQQQLRIPQWITPALTGAPVVLGALNGEQQRPAERLRGLGKKARQRGQDLLPG
jgi:hypothetical protein